MNLKKALISSGLIVVLICAITATQVLGAEAFDSTKHKIIGPTMWAVGVVDCTGTPFFTLRLKKIDGCDVDTDPLSGIGELGGITGCPTGEADILHHEIGKPFTYQCEALITRVRNYKQKGDIISFDAQIEFFVLDDDPRETCPQQ